MVIKEWIITGLKNREESDHPSQTRPGQSGQIAKIG
jgi:hypothetical protein